MSNTDLLLSSYDYFLPEELIAQNPADQRQNSRLLVYQKTSQTVEHSQFHQIENWLKSGDLLVLNDTKVFPARIFGQKAHTGTRFEFLLTRQIAQDHWQAMAKNSKRIRAGYRFEFAENVFAEVLTEPDGGLIQLKFNQIPDTDFWAWLERHGEIPYPPYITARESEAERYQTVYSRERGSVAAPTAGLHFTPELLAELKDKGIDHVSVTLHVGIGTFSPVRTEQIEDHQMHSEHYQMPANTALRLNQQRESGQRILAVGTTATRTLETVWRKHDQRFAADQGETDIFIYPGQTIGAIDGLITNFHLPCSTLLMLVSALIGREKLLELYQTAIAEKYRFYSFGDAMLLI